MLPELEHQDKIEPTIWDNQTDITLTNINYLEGLLLQMYL